MSRPTADLRRVTTFVARLAVLCGTAALAAACNCCL